MDEDGSCFNLFFNYVMELLEKLSDVLWFMIDQWIYDMFDVELGVVEVIHAESCSDDCMVICDTRWYFGVIEEIEILGSFYVAEKYVFFGLGMGVYFIPVSLCFLQIVIDHCVNIIIVWL